MVSAPCALPHPHHPQPDILSACLPRAGYQRPFGNPLLPLVLPLGLCFSPAQLSETRSRPSKIPFPAQKEHLLFRTKVHVKFGPRKQLMHLFQFPWQCQQGGALTCSASQTTELLGMSKETTEAGGQLQSCASSPGQIQPRPVHPRDASVLPIQAGQPLLPQLQCCSA